MADGRRVTSRITRDRGIGRWDSVASYLLSRIYLLGLLAWLALGLLPALAEILPALHHGLIRLAVGHGMLATYAGRIIDHAMPGENLAWTAVAYLFSIFNLALGVLLMYKRPDDLVPRLLAFAFMGTAATFNEPSHQVFHILGEPPAIKAIHFTFHVVSGVAYLWAVALFPDGKLPVLRSASRSTKAFVSVATTAAIAIVCWRSSFISHPPFFVVFFGALVPVVGIAAQTIRLRGSVPAAADVVSAEQSRLLRASLIPALIVAAAWVCGELIAHTAGASATSGTTVANTIANVFPAVFAVVPLTLFVAIIRTRLWDIDLVARQALLITFLLGAVAAIYACTLALTGWLTRDSGLAALVALCIVACVAEPIRQRCQHVCNRLVFGQELSSREALTALVDRFSGVGDVDEMTELTSVIVRSTRADSAAIWLLRDRRLVPLAAYPRPPGMPVELSEPTLEASVVALSPARLRPVMYEDRLLGVIAVTTPSGVSLPRRESRLLDALSDHVGLLVANAQLTIDLADELDVVTASTHDLDASRQQVVVIQDLQRRQLERDIHDGAQQQLISLILLLRAAQRRGTADGPALEQLHAIGAATRETLGRLASGGAPAVLVEAGLAPALADVAAQVRQVGIDVQVSVEEIAEPSPDAATAIYFCCLEAVQNAVKHAHPAHIWLEVGHDASELRFTVADDGAGYDSESVKGSGLRNVATRVGALGGRIDVTSARGGGTVVRGRVPLGVIPRPRQPMPDADRSPDADRTPEGGRAPDADRTPKADRTPDPDRTPEGDRAPDADRLPDADRTPEVDRAPRTARSSDVNRLPDASQR